MPFSIAAPAATPYGVGLLFAIVSQLIVAPLCAVAHKAHPALALSAGLAAAVLPLYVQPWLTDVLESAGVATPLDTLMGRFCGGTTYAFVAFRLFGACQGALPKGADVDLATFITFCTGSADVLFDKESGKPLSPPGGALGRTLLSSMLRLGALSVVSSISHPFGGFPAVAQLGAAPPLPALAAAYAADYVLAQLLQIYLFLSLLYDVGACLLLAQGFQPLATFDNPIFTCRSPRDFWGKKWNIQVTATFKRIVFVPLRKLHTPPVLAALVTFLFSGLFHEYQFVVSMRTYKLGTIGGFFALQGLIAAGDAVVSRSPLQPFLLSLPAPLKPFLVMVAFSPTIPLFSSVWLDESMFDLMARISCRIVL